MNFTLPTFEPNYTLLTFLFIKTFLFTEALGVLGCIRMLIATRAARWAAFGAFLLGLLAVAAKYIPPVAGLTGTNLGNSAAQLVNAGNGMALPIAASLVLALSALLPGRRWWALDVLHVLSAIGFFGLWVYTLL